MRDAARAAIGEALAACGNPSSVHRAGRAARALLAASRAAVAEAVGLPPGGELTFTSGGTEANLLALRGAGRRVLRSAIEHDSVRAAVADATIVPVGPDGRVDLQALETLLAATGAPALVSVMAANNETGVLQPIRDVARLAHAAGALVHCDAVQAVGKVPFDMAALGLDLVSLSAHKLGGPQGVAALAVAPGVALAAQQPGGGQERGLRAGTENLPGIAGFAAAITAAVAELATYARLAALRDEMEARLLEAVPQALVAGQGAARLPNTSCVALPGLPAETQVIALDLAGVGVSAGSACSSGKVRPSHVLEAMGYPAAIARSSIRISLGRNTIAAEIDRLVAAWIPLAARAKRSAA